MRGSSGPLLIVLLVGCGALILMCGILSAVLFPVFTRARQAARTSVCLSNQAQLASAALMYVEDNGTFMVAGRWMDQSERYAEPELFHCTRFPDEPEKYGYAMNSEVAGNKPSDVKDPKTPLFYDSANVTRNASDPFTSLPSQGAHSRSEGPANNITAIDGSSRSEPAGPR